MSQWCSLVEARFGRNYELFEAYVIRNVLLIPDKFVLPAHRDLLAAGQKEQVASDPALTELVMRFQHAKAAEAILLAEERQLQEEERILASLEAQLDMLKGKLAQHKRNNRVKIEFYLNSWVIRANDSWFGVADRFASIYCGGDDRGKSQHFA